MKDKMFYISSKAKSSDRQLVIKVKNDQINAFVELFEQYSQRLYCYSRSLLKNHEDAEGVVQEVFFRIWKKRHELDEQKSFQSFLFCIAYNLIVNQFKKRVRDQKYEQFLINKAQQNYLNPENELEFRELKNQVIKAINKLPKRRKKIYQLSRENGLSYKEIAASLHIKSKTVENQLNLALKHIRKQLSNEIITIVLFLCLFML